MPNMTIPSEHGFVLTNLSMSTVSEYVCLAVSWILLDDPDHCGKRVLTPVAHERICTLAA